MKFVVCFLVVLTAFFGASQKNTQAKGTLFASLGINNMIYFPSNLHFPSKSTVTITGFDSQSIKQWNAKIGYYFQNHISISLRFDKQYFNYTNLVDYSNNFLNTSFEICGTEKLLNTKNKKFAVSGIVGASVGTVWNQTKRFELLNSQQTSWKCSGISLALMVALRTEFYKRFYFQLEERMQLFHQNNQSNSTNLNENTTHYLGMTQTSLTLGYFMYRKFYDDCNTCPKW
jgi:hypothetical protein